MVGPEGLPPEQFDALVAGWDPAEAPLVQFLVARGFLDRIGAQTLSTVLKGYVQLRGVGLCNLFKGLPGPAAPSSRPTPARSGAREAGSRDRDASPRDAPREAPGPGSPHSTPSVSAALAFAPRPGPREASRPNPVAASVLAVVEATPVAATPVAATPVAATPMVAVAPTARSESAAQEFARLSLRAQISELRAELVAGRGRRDAPRHPSEPGDHCAHYTLIRRLGESAHSLVFQARPDHPNHSNHGQGTVALKLPRPDAPPASLPRFAAQSQIHARLAHAGVLPLIDVGGRDGLVYLAYADMGTVGISSYLRQLSGRVQAWTLAQLFVDVAQVLDAAARVGILHGDLKPANILMCEHDARVRLTDFGMRIPGAPPGPFIAPELALGGQGTVQADMYSLGAVLQSAAVGQAGPVGPLQESRPDLPADLVTAIDRMTTRSPRDRPASWEAAIAAVLAACPRIAGPAQPGPRT
jgi:hypothetical protein